MVCALSLPLQAVSASDEAEPESPAAAPAVAEPPHQLVVKNVWVDVPLTKILRDIAMQTGVSVSAGPGVPDTLISLDVGDGLPLDECLRRVIAGQGLAMRRLDENLYLVGRSHPDSPGFNELADSERVQLNYISAEHLRASVPPSVRQYILSGERKFEVLLFGPDSALEVIRKVVRQLDVPGRQVVLEALVVELSEEASRKLGMDWERSGPDTIFSLVEGPESFVGGVNWTSVDQRDLRQLMLTIRMLVRDEEASVRSRPRVATVDGEKALINIAREEFFNIVTDINGDFLQTELQKIAAGVKLEMTPHVGKNDDITVSVMTEVSDVISRSSNIAGDNDNGSNDLPIVRRRVAETRVRVKEGDAIVIGGLIETQEKDTVKRVPILGSIPLLGVAFRSTETVFEKTEVVIFITPRLLEDGKTELSDRHDMVDVSRELNRLRSEKYQTAPPDLPLTPEEGADAAEED